MVQDIVGKNTKPVNQHKFMIESACFRDSKNLLNLKMCNNLIFLELQIGQIKEKKDLLVNKVLKQNTFCLK